MQTLFIILAVAFPISLVFILTRKPKAEAKYKPIEKTDLNPDELELVRLFNQHRLALGHDFLIPEVLCSSICQERLLSDIRTNTKLSHYGCEKMIDKCKGLFGGHIYASTYISPAEMFKAYIESKEGHKESIENPLYTHIGISYLERKNHCLLIKYK